VSPSLLARVGDVEITVDDLGAYESGLASGHEGLDHQIGLEILVDRELLVLEARALGLHEDQEIQRELQEVEDRELATTMLRRQLAQADVSEEEIERAYIESGWGEQIRALEIFVPTAAEARAVHDLLQQGRDFGDVARQHAIDPVFRVPAGGPRQTLYWPFDRPRDVVTALFQLSPGGVTPPIAQHQGFTIASVQERTQVDLATASESIRTAVLKEKRKQLHHSYLRYLKWDFGIDSRAEGMDLVVAVLRGEVSPDSLDDTRRHLPVYVFEGFSMDVVEVLDAVAPASRSWPEATEAVISLELAESHIPNTLMARDARRKGVDQSEPFQRWRRAQMEDLMLTALRARVLTEVREPEEADIQTYYEENRQHFRSVAWVRIQEVLVADPDLARDLVAQLAAGAPMDSMAAAYSLRDTENGIVEVSTLHMAAYGEIWMNAVMNAPESEVRGPIKTSGGFSVFKVIERHPERFHTLDNERVRQAVEREVRQRQQRQHFNLFAEDVRMRYADRVTIYEDNVNALSPAAGS
jgi:parvulin-like peptidyl-prolyl isomerase